MYSDIAPYVISENNKVSGFMANHVNEIAATAHVDLTWENVPWDRQLSLLKKNQPNICAVSLYRTAKREKFIQFSDPIGIDHGSTIIGTATNQTLLKHKSFKALIGDPDITPMAQALTTFGPYINNLLDSRDPVIRTSASTKRMLRSIIGNTDVYVILPGFFSTDMLKTYVLEKDLAIYPHFKDILIDVPYHIGCTKATAVTTIERINSAIQQHGQATIK